jgi:hypothetical protein
MDMSEGDRMSAKPTFSRADVAAINARIARYSTSPVASADLARAPMSPIAAKVMREIGVSREKLNEAFRIARTMVDAEKKVRP